MTAKADELGTLHALVAKVLKEDISDPERRTPAHIAQAVKFLKDNGIEARMDKNPALAALDRELADLDLDDILSH